MTRHIPGDEKEWSTTAKTVKKPAKPILAKGDVSWCKKCEASTIYGGTCAVCGVPTVENRRRFAGWK